VLWILKEKIMYHGNKKKGKKKANGKKKSMKKKK
tara:strand:- start:971 stop:1072 length:102 start_codon:yes stop_codon:yes gene_type:complete